MKQCCEECDIYENDIDILFQRTNTHLKFIDTLFKRLEALETQMKGLFDYLTMPTSPFSERFMCRCEKLSEAIKDEKED